MSYAQKVGSPLERRHLNENWWLFFNFNKTFIGLTLSVTSKDIANYEVFLVKLS